MGFSCTLRPTLAPNPNPNPNGFQLYTQEQIADETLPHRLVMTSKKRCLLLCEDKKSSYPGKRICSYGCHGCLLGAVATTLTEDDTPQCGRLPMSTTLKDTEVKHHFRHLTKSASSDCQALTLPD